MDEDMLYDEWRDMKVADELKNLPDGIYQKNEKGMLVKVAH